MGRIGITVVKIAIAILLIAVIIFVAINAKTLIDPQLLKTKIDRLGIFGPIVFLLVFTVATILFVPGMPLSIAGGFIFGPLYGTIYNIVGSVLGAGAAFLIARYLGTDWITTRVEKAGPKLQGLMDNIKEEGWWLVGFLRLLPLTPFTVLNYAFGLTKITFRSYIISSAIFMAPGCLAYAYLGEVGVEAMTGGEKLMEKFFVALSLLAVIIFLPNMIKILRKNPKKNSKV